MVCRLLDIAELCEEIKLTITAIEELENDRNAIRRGDSMQDGFELCS
jgi:hypothetical protein